MSTAAATPSVAAEISTTAVGAPASAGPGDRSAGPAARGTSSARGRRALRGRALLAVPAGVAGLAGLDAGAVLLDLPVPVSAARLPEVHGVLLVLGMLGTLVALERAVALGRAAGYLAPALLGGGGLLLLAPVPLAVGRTVQLAGALALVGLYVPLWRRQRDDAVLVQAWGAVLATGAAALWLGGMPVPGLLPWLVGFLVLSIAGERLELARLAMDGRAAGLVVLTSGGLVCAVTASLLWPRAGHLLLGATVLALVGMLWTHDVARRTIRSSGLPRYMAAGMLAAYAWLAVAGAIWLIGGAAGPGADGAGGAGYDAVVHAVFLGFGMSMVMTHAPVILPAVLRRPLPYRPAFLAPLMLLHLSLALRLWAGDALGSRVAWQVGGAANIVALLAFAALAVWSALTAERPEGRR